MTKQTNEDSYFSNALKRTAAKAAKKVLPKGLGGAAAETRDDIRKRASELYNTWKKVEASGKPQTIKTISNWVRSGENPISPSVFNTALKKYDLNHLGKDTPISNSKTRDLMISIAEFEAQNTNSVDFVQTKSQKAARERKANNTATKRNAATSSKNTKVANQNFRINKTQEETIEDMLDQIERLERKIDRLERSNNNNSTGV